MSFRITRWESATPPNETLLLQIMHQQKLNPSEWSNRPYDTYSAHKHDYDKVIYVVRGSITFNLPTVKQKITLKAGDRLDLPAHVVHSAEVSAEGVTCLEGHLKKE